MWMLTIIMNGCCWFLPMSFSLVEAINEHWCVFCQRIVPCAAYQQMLLTCLWALVETKGAAIWCLCDSLPETVWNSWGNFSTLDSLGRAETIELQLLLCFSCVCWIKTGGLFVQGKINVYILHRHCILSFWNMLFVIAIQASVMRYAVLYPHCGYSTIEVLN